MSDDLRQALLQHQDAFGIELTPMQIDGLSAYHAIIQENNPLLHLVAPCPPEEFATRHILESLTLLKHLPGNAKIADVGSGAGLPSVPCLIVREDLRGRLIDSKEKKARFLAELVEKLGIDGRTDVVNKQFIETHPGDATHVTCRALEKFVEWVPRLVRWSRSRPMLLFGGPALGEALIANRVRNTSELMPMSTRRYLFVTVSRGS